MPGIEHDEARVAQLTARRFAAVAADATDTALWRRLVAVGPLRTVVLAMPFHHANLGALRSRDDAPVRPDRRPAGDDRPGDGP